MKIVTVLKTGGDFRTEHAVSLRDQCKRFAPGAFFVCLTDDPEALKFPGLNSRQLRHGWPGWWSKIEAFRLPGPTLYVDLDTVIVGHLQPLLDVAVLKLFTVLRDFNPGQRVMGSGLMAWSDSVGAIYERFRKKPQTFMDEMKSPRWYGDQGFIEATTDAMKTPRTYWQDAAPGAVVSFKKHCAAGVPAGARVVCYHGKPRPWEAGGRLGTV